jgi:diguanylate cyclase (GGDEF)-like protein/PAS domain S-box-containing protein
MAKSVPRDDAFFTDIASLRAVIDAVPHPIFVKDDQTRFVVVNDMMCALMNRSFAELVGKWDYDFVPKEQADVFRGNDLRVLGSGEINESEELFSDGQGRLRTIVTRKKRVVLSNGTRLLVGCITDISDFRHAEALIRHHAEHDALTGLANRRRFYEELEERLSRSDRGSSGLAVLVVDLDRFKPINDAYGHTTGDSVLCEVASRLKAVVRKGDTVARLGGDEFAIITESNGSPAEAAGRLAARIIAAVGKPVMAGDVAAEVGASIGISQHPTDGQSAEALLHAADVAMYRGKREGRGTFRFFEHRMDAEIREQAALEADLRRAVARGEILPHYQPLMSLSDNRLLGFEILARWLHPERGFVPPDLFIPLTEKLGIVSDLTFSLLRTAGRDAKKWPPDMSLSLNISPVQLSDGMLPVALLAVLNEVGFPPGRLEVEITENALVSDIESAKAILTSFQNLGMKVALDDFGTGYSSLYHLRELRFDKIKIDRSFVQSMRSNPESAKIVNAILGLAKSLGLPATAEGIENIDVLNEVVEAGAEFGQGYYFGKAVPAEDVPSIIELLNPRPARRKTG